MGGRWMGRHVVDDSEGLVGRHGICIGRGSGRLGAGRGGCDVHASCGRRGGARRAAG